MRKFGLIGYPLGHSFSKQYFTDKFRREKIVDCSYENYPISDIAQIKDIIKSEPELCGLNVTIPYKTKIIDFLDFIAEEAEEIGAVNVIKIKRDKNKTLLYGYNSDYVGVSDSLRGCIEGMWQRHCEGDSPKQSSEIQCFGLLHSVRNDGKCGFSNSLIKQALILGTGGASKAVHYTLQKAGVTVQFVSREKSAGVLTYSELTPKILATTQLIVNSTPLGMFPNIKSLPEINYKCLGSKHILFDLVYNPEITAFLQKGIEQGCTIVTGVKMLVSQAERAWQIWNDRFFA